MPTFDSDLLAADFNDPNLVTYEGGRLRASYATYTLDGSEVDDDIVRMVKLPPGALVHAVVAESDQIDGTADGATTPTDLIVGDADTDNRYVANLSPDSGAVIATYGLGDAAGERPVPIDSADKETILVTFSAVDAEAAAVISVAVYYTLD